MAHARGVGSVAGPTILKAWYIRLIYVARLHRQDAPVPKGRSDPSPPLDVSSLDLAPPTPVGGAFSRPREAQTLTVNNLGASCAARGHRANRKRAALMPHFTVA